jgi:CubicO group peptidase (beta-lactamase class C family)
MTRSSRALRGLAIFVLLTASVTASPAAAQGGGFDLEKTRTVLTGLIQKALQDRGIPSVSIALVRGDSIVWTAAFGYANVRTRTAATPETYYSTGSTFKAATATAILQLVEQGKIGLDQPVNRYLGDVQVQDRLQVEKPVTFRHILSHWSGLTAGANTRPIWGRELPKPLDTMVDGLYSIRAPETKWEYNNYAYGMAGLLIEKISGLEYEKYMVEHVLKPLGVTTANPVYPSADMVERMALPYNAGGASGQPRPVQQVHFDVYPAGDLWLTAEEMARFLGAHLNGGVWQGKRILSEASVKQAHEPQFGGTYAFGWSVSKDDKGHTLISHTGGIPGMSSYMLGDLDAKVGVYFMSNSGAPTSIGDAAIQLLRGEAYVPPPEKKAIAVDPKILDTYVGTYDLDGNTITVSRSGTGLVIQPSGQPQMQLLAETPTRFFITGVPLTITFGTGPDGAVDRLEVESGGGKQVAKKRK